MRFTEILEEYIDYHKSLCHTEKTIRSYIEILTIFDKVVGIDDYTKMTFNDIKKYQKYVYSKSLSIATVGSYFRHLKAFISWLEEFDYLEDKKLHTKIKVPKMPKKNIKIYTDAEIKLIFDAVETESPWLTARNKLIICLMLDSGLRRNEVCVIKHKDINYSDRLLNVHGKGNKDRLVPLGSLTLKYLKEYNESCPFDNASLLVNRRGQSLTNNAVKLFLSKMKTKLGFELSAHRLRHNFATNYIIDHYDKYGHFDSYTLMILLGHEEMSTTERYVHYAKQLIATRERCSHLDKVCLENGKR